MNSPIQNLSTNMAGTLLNIHDVLEKSIDDRIPYCIAGSTSLILQGCENIKEADIDVIVNSEDAYALEAAFHKNRTKFVKQSSDGMFDSHYGRLEINGITVDIMGDFKANRNGVWTTYMDRIITAPRIALLSSWIPVSDLEEQLVSYESLGRKKDIQKINSIRERLSTRTEAEKPVSYDRILEIYSRAA